MQWDVAGADHFEVDPITNVLTVDWGAAGPGQVSAFYFGNGCEAFAALCMEVIDRPKASFSTDQPSSNNELSICRGTSVQFQNLSQHASSFQWQFGDLGSTTMANPLFTFSEAGVFPVKLLAYNDCFCVDTTSFLVKGAGGGAAAARLYLDGLRRRNDHLYRFAGLW